MSKLEEYIIYKYEYMMSFLLILPLRFSLFFSNEKIPIARLDCDAFNATAVNTFLAVPVGKKILVELIIALPYRAVTTVD